jgi:3-phenylpropionate/cinnamic acid dioxygenase small subunit
VSNVYITGHRKAAASEPEEVSVSCRFLIYQNREEYETTLFVGKRKDVLRRQAGGGWKLVRRTITLDQSVLLAKYLTVFF